MSESKISISKPGFTIEQFDFTDGAFTESELRKHETADKLKNWPVVYVLNKAANNVKELNNVYIGETLSFGSRMRQHLKDPLKKGRLNAARVILDNRFNKSVCLDLESYLIQLAAGDASSVVVNRNTGIVDADYFDRAAYQEKFNEIFHALRDAGIFQRTIPQIQNSELFKLSPFKSLNMDQAVASEDIIQGLIEDLSNQRNELGNITVIDGAPGTGKTVVAIYLIKLIRDIGAGLDIEHNDDDSIFDDFFTHENRELMRNLNVALVIPQQSLRLSVKKVFANTPGLTADMVVSPWEVGQSKEVFDVLFVDESHRLQQKSNQSSGPLNKKFNDINSELFGPEGANNSQLDWVLRKSRFAYLMLDTRQTVRPQDLPLSVTKEILRTAQRDGRHYRLNVQMRSLGGNDYIDYVYSVLAGGKGLEREEFKEYTVGLVDSPQLLDQIILRCDGSIGLSRLTAGYAWEWKSKKSKSSMDIIIGHDFKKQWNQKDKDWINSKGSLYEVGSIHTVQGYDLNVCGVIIGPDLRYDEVKQELYIVRDSHHDKKAKESVAAIGPTTDAKLHEQIVNAYAVLLTRGIRATFIYAVDESLQRYLQKFFPLFASTEDATAFLEEDKNR